MLWQTAKANEAVKKQQQQQKKIHTIMYYCGSQRWAVTIQETTLLRKLTSTHQYNT